MHISNISSIPSGWYWMCKRGRNLLGGAFGIASSDASVGVPNASCIYGRARETVTLPPTPRHKHHDKLVSLSRLSFRTPHKTNTAQKLQVTELERAKPSCRNLDFMVEGRKLLQRLELERISSVLSLGKSEVNLQQEPFQLLSFAAGDFSIHVVYKLRFGQVPNQQTAKSYQWNAGAL